MAFSRSEQALDLLHKHVAETQTIDTSLKLVLQLCQIT